MPILKFDSVGSQWRVKGQALAIINENSIEKVRKDPVTFYPASGHGTAEGGLWSSGYHDGTALFSNSDGLHSAQAVRSEGWVSSSVATGVTTATITAGGVHEIAHNINGAAPPLIDTVSAAYSGAYIRRMYQVNDPNEGSLNQVKVMFLPGCIGPTWTGKRPLHGFKMVGLFADQWCEFIYDDTLFSNGGWRIRHKVRTSTGAWYIPGGDHIFTENRQNLSNYYVRGFSVITQGLIFDTSVGTNDFTFVVDSQANGNYVVGRSDGVSGAAPVSTGTFKPELSAVVEQVIKSA